MLTRLGKFNTRIERPPSYSSADTEELVHRARAVMGPTASFLVALIHSGGKVLEAFDFKSSSTSLVTSHSDSSVSGREELF